LSNTQRTAEEQPVAETNCPACLQQSGGILCMHCGEKLHPEKLTMKKLVREVPDVFFDIDSGLFYSMRTFLTHPGREIKHYFAGKRIRHYKPLKYVLFIGGINAFIYAKVPITNGEPQTPFEAFGTQWNSLILLIQLPLIAFTTWLLFRKQKYNYGEHFVANAFIIGEVSLFNIVLFPLRYFLNGTPNVIIGDYLYLIFILGYYTYAFYDWFYSRKGKVGIVLSFIFVFCLLIVVFIFTFIIQALLYYAFVQLGWA
jgi:hypothetical protein